MIINNKRALAYVVTIDEIKPIEGYDRVEYARTNGWWVIIGKQDNLHVGDKCVYFEVDSKVNAADERFAFLAKRDYKIKTQRMCKVISQGLLMPLSTFPELGDLDVNTDVTDLLKVTYSVAEDNARKNEDPDAKYKSMAARHKKIFQQRWAKWMMKRAWGRKIMFFFFGKKKDNPREFPSFVSKTDEERCLVGNTKVITQDGNLRIADIVNKRINTKVLCVNNNGDIEWKNIVSYQKYPLEEALFEIGYPYMPECKKKNHIVCSKDHQFYNGVDYIRADELCVGDTIYTIDNCYSEEIIPVVYGMLLGDSSIGCDKRSQGKLRIHTTNGEKQLEYLKYKASIFDENMKIYKMKSGYCDNAVYRFCTSADAYISQCLNSDWFINEKKTVTKQMVEKLTLISLAFWYMDDGTLRNKDEIKCSPVASIATYGFSKEENELLVDCLNNKFGVECKLRMEKNKYWGINFTVNGTKKFLEIITPYIHPSMRYKTLKEYENIPFIQIQTMPKREKLLPIKIEEIKPYNRRWHDQYIYDIEVEDNHNFFANHILTHNCENQPWRIGDGKTYLATEKLDGTSCTYALERKGKNKFEFYVCSRNVRQQDEKQECYHDHNIYWDLAFKYNIEKHLKDFLNQYPFPKWVCIQGEGVGSVQGNPLKLKEDDLYIFNFITSDTGRWASTDGKMQVEEWGMKWVPILGEVQLPDTMEELKELATGKSVVNPEVMREGIVYRSLDGQDSFKNVSREYLLSKKE